MISKKLLYSFYLILDYGATFHIVLLCTFTLFNWVTYTHLFSLQVSYLYVTGDSYKYGVHCNHFGRLCRV